MTKIWAGCLDLLKSSVTSVGLLGPGIGGGGIGGRGASKGVDEGTLKSGPTGSCEGSILHRNGHNYEDKLWGEVVKLKQQLSVLSAVGSVSGHG